MSKLRSVNTGFWDDEYIGDLSRDEQHLFLYFLTNPLTNMAGAYKIARKVIKSHTGFTDSELDAILRRFEHDKKAVYQDGWVVLNNWLKNQSWNDNMKKGVLANISDAPPWVSQKVIGFIRSSLTLSKAFEPFQSRITEIESLSKAARALSKSESESESEKEVETEVEVEDGGGGPDSAKDEDPVSLSPSSPRADTSGRPRQPAPADPTAEVHLGKITAGVMEQLGLTTVRGMGSQKDWHEAGLVALENGFTAAEFLECFSLLRNQAWRTSAVKPKQIIENLPNLSKLRTEGKSPAVTTSYAHVNGQPSAREAIRAEQAAIARMMASEAVQ